MYFTFALIFNLQIINYDNSFEDYDSDKSSDFPFPMPVNGASPESSVLTNGKSTRKRNRSSNKDDGPAAKLTIDLLSKSGLASSVASQIPISSDLHNLFQLAVQATTMAESAELIPQRSQLVTVQTLPVPVQLFSPVNRSTQRWKTKSNPPKEVAVDFTTGKEMIVNPSTSTCGLPSSDIVDLSSKKSGNDIACNLNFGHPSKAYQNVFTVHGKFETSELGSETLSPTDLSRKGNATPTNDNQPLNLSSSARKDEIHPIAVHIETEKSKIESSVTTQILLLNGKEYEIVPLGDQKWISRNEYELLKGLNQCQSIPDREDGSSSTDVRNVITDEVSSTIDISLTVHTTSNSESARLVTSKDTNTFSPSESTTKEETGDVPSISRGSTGDAVQLSRGGTGDAVQLSRGGTGDAVQLSRGGTCDAVQLSRGGTGDAVQLSRGGTGDAVQLSRGSTGDAVQLLRGGTGDAVQLSRGGTGDAVQLSRGGTGDAVQLSSDDVHESKQGTGDDSCISDPANKVETVSLCFKVENDNQNSIPNNVALDDCHMLSVLQEMTNIHPENFGLAQESETEVKLDSKSLM